MRDEIRNQREVGAVVALSPVRGGGEVGRIGLQHYPLQRDSGYVFPDSGFFECDHAAYAHVPVSGFLHPLEELKAAAERVEVAPEVQVPAILQDFQEIFGRVAQVYVDREVPLRSQFQLGAERLLLFFPEFLPPMVVESYFAHRNYAFIPVGEHRVQLFLPSLVHGAGIQPQHRSEDIGMLPHQGEHALPFLRVHVGLEHQAYAGAQTFADDFLLAARECLVAVVGMGIYIIFFHIVSIQS